MDVAELFGSNLRVIDRVARGVCHRAGVEGADAEDFVSAARLALMEDDYAVLRRYQGRSSLPTFLSVVFQNLLCDQRTSALGRWRPSREAERMGPAGVMLETLLRRDHRPFDDVLPLLHHLDPTLTRERVEAMAARLPHRQPRPRPVEIDEAVADTVPSPDRADDRALDREARDLSDRASLVVRQTLAGLPLEDRMLIRFRFARAMSIADISRMLRLPQRPLYRRIEALTQRLREALLAAGLDAASLMELIGSGTEMDFGLATMENAPNRQSPTTEMPAAAEESR